ncbi:hypothetical protein CHU98_g3434 [Xylaria longipes]|nr:hypothetical protein CHU98_g3434 [Xylaria longipes]
MSSVSTPEDVAAYKAAFNNESVVTVGCLPLNLDRAQVEAAIRENGFHTCTIFWALNQDGDATAPHEGWCQLAFPAAEDSKKAIGSLNQSKISSGVPFSYLARTEIQGEDATMADIDPTDYRRLPARWIPDPENPGAAEKAMFSDYKKHDTVYSQAGIKTRFRLWEDNEGNKGFHSIQRPRPLPADDDFARKEYVYMLAPGLDERSEYRLVPLAEVEQREEEGWTLWKCPDPPLDEDGRDRRQVQFPIDTFKYDKPHEDFERYWANDMELVKKQLAPPNWEPGMPLNKVYDEADNISTTTEFQPPNEWDQVVTGSSAAHYPIIRRPAGVGAGWGDYDKFAQWQSYGRRIKADMVENKKWDKEMTELVFVDSDDPTLEMTIPMDKKIQSTFPPRSGIPPQSLYEKLHGKQDNKGKGSKK